MTDYAWTFLWQMLSAATARQNHHVVIFCFAMLFQVHSHVDVYNFTSNTWIERFDMPKEMSNSHLGMTSDGRYIYAVTGQFGPQCRPAVNRNFVLDTKIREWGELTPLAVPRYAF